MSGECKSYRLNDPMQWAEFRTMPDDLKVTYIKLLRQKFNVPDAHIFKMMGINNCSFSKEMSRLGLAVGKRKANTPWDKEGFMDWAYGVVLQEEAKEEQPAEVAEEFPVVEDDLPWTEPEEEEEAPASEPVTLTSLMAVPDSGSMTFTGDATRIMNTLVNLFGGAKIKINVNWDVMED